MRTYNNCPTFLGSALAFAISTLICLAQANAQQSPMAVSVRESAEPLNASGGELRTTTGSWQHPNAELSGSSQPSVSVVTASSTTQAPALPNRVGGLDSPLAISVQESKRIPLLPPSRSSGSKNGDRGSGTVQMVVSVGSSLLIVVGLFLGVAWCYRKTLNSSIAGALPKQVVSVVGRTPLAVRQQLVLVRFGSKLVLVNVVQGEARTISEITDPVEVDRLAGLCESSRPESITQSFRSILGQGATT